MSDESNDVMRLDLRKLYSIKRIDINEDINFNNIDYQKMNITKINDMHATGYAKVNYEDNIELELDVNGSLVMPCAITSEDVIVPINVHISEEILENTLNNDFFLDLLDILWENIVLEIPIRVVKEGAKLESQKGVGWEIISE